ncbi:MAG TPA: hypothetical protein VF131_02400 [Blastocatellia bacterium]|nr:hypothetical protein [Blastocatellia bacterium]
MLKATKKEREHVLGYMLGQAPDETVELAQKVYSEQVHTVRHDIWDVHTSLARWWVITNPTNLYSQSQFPNMDLALTFHVGLCLRIPRSEHQSLTDIPVEPLVACWRTVQEASEALSHAEEVEDFQAIGMRCRESLINLVHVAQELVKFPNTQPKPKRSDFRSWSEIVANAILPGSSNQDRRGLLKSSADAAWKFANWLTHAKVAHLNDAEAAVGSTEFTISLFTTGLIRYVRGVPDRCPSCGSQRLSPQRGIHSSDPDTTYERPVCEKCGWTGMPVIVKPSPPKLDSSPPEGECAIMSTPLLHFPNLSDGHDEE